MINETLFLGGCPVIRPEGIYLNGVRVISLGLQGIGLGDAGDLLAYRQEWEPFIAAHLNLWRSLSDLLESVPESQKCPPGIFDPAQIANLDSTTRAFCSSLDLTRIRTSPTSPGGILEQWNLWKDRSSADIVAGATEMLKWHQDVVMRVAGPYKDELLQIAQLWGVPIELPPVPSFSAQQQIIARIEGAYITTKGVLQILGYGVGEILSAAGNQAQAAAQGLSETARAIPKAIASPWTWIGVSAVLAVVGGALVVYYMPRRAGSS